MFLGTYHGRVYGESEKDTVAVEDTYNILIANKQLKKDEILLLDKNNLMTICNLAKQCLLEDPTVLKVRPHIHIIGDIKGNYNSIWDMIQTNETTDQFLFLGDYVNEGKNSIEVITLVLCMKLIAPKQVFLLRGSSETPGMTRRLGFKNECEERYDNELYHKFIEVFDCMPLAAVINDEENTKSILCLNGGISPEFTSLKRLEKVERPLKESDMILVHSMLWSDPTTKVNKFGQHTKQPGSYVYGKESAHQFLKENHIDQIIRSHQYQEKGYCYPYGDNDHSVLSIFSAPFYYNGKEHRNIGTTVYVRESMLYTLNNFRGDKHKINNEYQY